jgi:hypothetical protein
MSTRAGLSLSFLDLVTCGFGGVTLVFLILLAVQGRLADPASSASPGRATQAVSPFILWVEAEAPPPATGLPTSAPFWDTPGTDPWSITGRRASSARTGFGPRQAVYIAPETPAEGAKVLLGPLADKARFRIVAVHRGRTIRLDSQTPADWSPDLDGRITLWPGPLSAAIGVKAVRP